MHDATIPHLLDSLTPAQRTALGGIATGKSASRYAPQTLAALVRRGLLVPHEEVRVMWLPMVITQYTLPPAVAVAWERWRKAHESC